MSSHALESLAVVSVSYNSSEDLDGFLASVAASEDVPITVLIADNASADVEESDRIVSAHGGRLLRLPDNRGYGGAINAAIAALPEKVRYVLISNPDVIIHPGAPSALLAGLEGDPRAGAVGPRVLNEDGSVYPSARRIPSLRSGIGHALFADLWPANPWTRSYRAESSASEAPRRAGWLSGSCLLVRREAFESIGGFDEGYFMYFEDVDLGYRLGRAGWDSVYLPHARVTHAGAHSTRTESERMLRAHHDSAYRFLERKYAAPYLLPLRWFLKAGLEIRSAHARRLARRAS